MVAFESMSVQLGGGALQSRRSRVTGATAQFRPGRV